MSLARDRLTNERKKWRADPIMGFFARPKKNADKSVDILTWECGIPGRKGTPWEGNGSVYTLELRFDEDYPTTPPKCSFATGFYHPNVYPSGKVCLSILDEDKDWRPAITIKDVLLGIAELLVYPNEEDPAQQEALTDYKSDLATYEKKVKAQAQRYAPQ